MSTETAATRKPESPDKVRWMLWLRREALDQLAAESAAIGRPMAQIVRDATDARIGLSPEVVARYHIAAQRRGVPVSQLFQAAMTKAAPKL